MNGLHQPLYAVLCLVSALAGSWTALDLFGRIHANIGRARSAWLIAASLALGLSIWAADFEAVLGARSARAAIMIRLWWLFPWRWR